MERHPGRPNGRATGDRARRRGPSARGRARRPADHGVVLTRARPRGRVLSRAGSRSTMRPILTPAEASELDRQSRERGITVEQLMESAGRAVARSAAVALGGVYGRRAVLVCGKGNNGGDGFVAARYLARWGVRPTVIRLADAATIREPSSTMLRAFHEVGGRVRGLDALDRELARSDVVIDAIFGTGFRGVPEGEASSAIDALNASGLPVVAVDIPSGVDGESGAVDGAAVRATATVTFGAAKPGLLFQPGRTHAGVIQVVDIGFPVDLMQSDLVLMEHSDVAALWPRRDPGGHKRSSGVVLVIAGSRRMTGAVRLVAESAYRAGAGLVTVAVPDGILPVAEQLITEATFLPLPETSEGTIAASAVDLLRERVGEVDAVAIGPGLTTTR